MGAGGAEIGALRVSLGSDTASFDTGLKNSGATLAKFASIAATGLAAVAAAVVSTAAAIGYSIKSSIDEADKMGKMSQSIGVPVEELSKLKYAADLSDISVESLGKSVGKLSKAMVESANSGTGPAAQAFKAMGVSVRDADGQLKSSSVMMDEIATKFATYEDGAQKTALAMAIFGKAGAAMIPLLNAGKVGLKQSAEEAEAFGLVISTKTSKASEAFNDNLKRLSLASTGVANIITSRLAPALEEWSNSAVDVLRNSGAIQAVAEGLAVAIGYVGAAAIETAGYMKAGWEAASSAATGLFKIAQAVGGVVAAAFGEAVKWVSGLAQSFTAAVQNSAILNKASQTLNASFELLSNGAAIVGAVFKAVWDAVAGVASAVLSIVQGQFQNAWDVLKNGTGKVGESVRTATTEVQSAWKAMGDGATSAGNTLATATGNAAKFLTGMTTAATASEEAAKKIQAPWRAANEEQQKALSGFLASQAKRTAAQNAEAATIGMAAGALERLRVIKQADEILDQNKIARTPAVIQSITAAADAASAAALKIQAANISQMVMSPAEKYAQDLANLQTVYQSTDMTAATFSERQKQLAESVGATWEQAGVQAASGFGQLASEFGKSSKEMAVAAKAFAIVEATINTYTAFTKALNFGVPPFNYVAAAGVLASGMAKVMAIKSQSIPTGMMTGGSMTVSGGGGPDSVPLNMMVSPGEQIDVWRPDQGGGSDPRGGRGGGGKTVVLQGFAWGRDQMAELFAFLNEGMRDGHKLDLKFA